MTINDQIIDLALILAAQRDEAESRTQLVQCVEQGVFPYVYRLTLDHHLAQDLCQETVMALIQNLSTLQFDSTKSFWGWVYRTALNKVKNHVRKRDTQHVLLDKAEMAEQLAPCLQDQVTPPLDRLMREELLRAALKAMKAMRLSYRNALVLRCLQGLSYDEMAPILGSTPLGSRLLFFKAKKKLQHQMRQNGFESSSLCPALALVASVTLYKPTATSAAQVTQQSLEVGSVLTVVGTLVSKMGLAVAAVILMMFTAMGIFIHHHTSQPLTTWPDARLNRWVDQGRFMCPTEVAHLGPEPLEQLSVVNFYYPPEAATRVSRTEMARYLDVNHDKGLRLPRGIWIEVEFGDAILLNGPGPDIYLTASGCKGLTLSLWNEQGESFHYPHHPCHNWSNHSEQKIIAFDLQEQPSHFKPKRLRIRASAGNEDPRGLELQSICARVKN